MKSLEKCPFCGKNLKYLNISLTEIEKEDLQYSVELDRNAENALRPEVINALNLKDDDIFKYFEAVFNQQAKGAFLRWIFERDLKNRYKIDQDINIFVYNGEVYSHE